MVKPSSRGKTLGGRPGHATSVLSTTSAFLTRSTLLALSGLLLAPLTALGAPPAVPTVAVLAPDASLVAAQEGGVITIWERATGRRRASIKSKAFFRGAIAAGGLVAVVDDEGIRVWPGPAFSRPVTLRTPKVLTMGRAFISGNARLVAALFPADGGVGDPDSVGLWDARSGARRATLSLKPGRVLGVSLSTDGALVAFFGDVPAAQQANRGGGPRALLRVFRLKGDKTHEVLRWESPQDRTTYSAGFSADGRWLALGAGERLHLFDLGRRKLAFTARTDEIKALFPPGLRGPAVQVPGAHQVAFSSDGKQLLTFFGMSVVGVCRWSVTLGARAALRPIAWIKRPRAGGTIRQVAWDPQGQLQLITSTYSPNVWVHTPREDRFIEERVLTP